jgi:hypothetical protein
MINVDTTGCILRMRLPACMIDPWLEISPKREAAHPFIKGDRW